MRINVKGTWIDTDPGQSSRDPGAPDDGGSMPSGGDAFEIPPGKRSPVSPASSGTSPGGGSDGRLMPPGGDAVEIPPGKRDAVSLGSADPSPGGGSNPKFSLEGGGETFDTGRDVASLWNSRDPLDAFLDGLKGFLGDGGAGFSPSGAAGPPDTLLSNGLKADAAVAQLVNALASVTDNKSSFLATPFAAPGEPSTQGVIAAEVR
jgi:hypothetical protein